MKKPYSEQRNAAIREWASRELEAAQRHRERHSIPSPYEQSLITILLSDDPPSIVINIESPFTNGEAYAALTVEDIFPTEDGRSDADVHAPNPVAFFVRRLSCSPPLDAEFLFHLFLNAKNCEALVGDLEELYQLVFKKFGSRRAKFWYWTQAIRSVWPIFWAWVKKVSFKPFIGMIGWAVGRGFLGHDSWLATAMEIWNKIRS